MSWDFHADGNKSELEAALNEKGSHHGETQVRAQGETQAQITAGIAAAVSLAQEFGDDTNLRATVSGHANPVDATPEDAASDAPAWVSVKVEAQEVAEATPTA